ncbi:MULTISPECIES: hypothetical protein [unclassified Treponema]|uniref:hypothetical protein n=1 Tax=unclassified Treponema TaxID=2638727 RepID=UPI0020A5070F|nr:MULTISPECIES: hypothetical protein [unclassified Treponema]UTC66073.1 hypothetical protein E4O06_08565 [Treponema sp. OMZ 789]UTC68803.1 hypothetical protein E4O01_08705 [Treponema sp. OMZ 790]UTC71531.1 hypothetical protein E4O02_08895 [Treponema sp. OMZ 791]
MKFGVKFRTAAFISLILFTFPIFSQDKSFTDAPSSSDKRVASEEFRRGVQAYYRGTFNEAILLFEKALSYLPGEALILDWLGKAYYGSGVEGAALTQWEFAEASGYGGMLLKNKIEVLKESRSLTPYSSDNITYVENSSFNSKNGNVQLFRQPLSIAAIADGSFWMTAYGSNELLHFNVNGIILDRTRGPIQGFDRPFDVIALSDGNLLVSEFAADRLSLLDKNGSFIKSFGKRGLGNGEFIGPQFLAEDDYGNIYVCDFGNARIAVFSSAGEPLFTFGKKNGLFGGFTAPSGLAIVDGLVYVADAVKGAVYTFDTAGNFVQSLLPEGTLKQIESLREWNGNLVASAGNKVYLIDIAFSTVSELMSLGNAPTKITAAVPDVNGSLLLIDHKNQTVEITSRINELAGGLFVLIKKVYSDKFPEVLVEISVQNRDGKPIVGLTQDNFILTEGHRPVADYSLTGSSYLNETCDIVVIVERSPNSLKEKTLIETALKEIAEAMQGRGKIGLISASSIPVLEGKFSPADLITLPNRIKAHASPDWKFDLALRLAVGELINAEQKRAVLFLNLSDPNSDNFKQYNLNDLAAYMKNNNVHFYSINLKQGAPASEMSYLAKKTDGKTSYIYAEKGLKPIIDDIIDKPIGMYQLKYTSTMPTDFGRAFLPVEVEVQLLKRSGRDEIGYFAPLE